MLTACALWTNLHDAGYIPSTQRSFNVLVGGYNFLCCCLFICCRVVMKHKKGYVKRQHIILPEWILTLKTTRLCIYGKNITNTMRRTFNVFLWLTGIVGRTVELFLHIKCLYDKEVRLDGYIFTLINRSSGGCPVDVFGSLKQCNPLLYKWTEYTAKCNSIFVKRLCAGYSIWHCWITYTRPLNILYIYIVVRLNLNANIHGAV